MRVSRPPQKIRPVLALAFLVGWRRVNVASAALAIPLGLAAPAAAQQRVLGIDVSAWQSNIPASGWATLKRPVSQQVDGVFGDGRDFVFIRASRGGTTGYYNQSDADNSDGLNTLSQRYDDPYYIQNITRATSAGLFAGSYHFSRPDIATNTGADEADHFMQMAGPWMRPGYLLPVHDLEDGSPERTSNQLAQFTVDFSDRIYAVMGIRPLVYLNGNYAAQLQNASSALRGQVTAGNLLWTARWPNQADPDAIPVQTEHPHQSVSTVYGPWDDSGNPAPWKFWQYASTGRLNGYNDGNSNIDLDVAQGGVEFLKDQLVPAVWMTNANGDWSTLANWNSGLPATAPVQGPGQVARVGPMTLPATRLPGGDDTVILDRPAASIAVALSSGTHTIRKLYVRESLNITGGSLALGYVPSADSTTFAAQFSGPVSLGGSGSLSVHTVQVDAAQTFTVTGGTLAFNTLLLTPHATTPAKFLLSGNAIFSGLAGVRATVANGASTGTSGFVDLGGATRTINVLNAVSGTDLSINVPITNGALHKTGAGALALTSTGNTYSGGTTIQQGRVELGGRLNSGITVNGGGILAFGTITGIREVNGSLAVNSGGIFRVRIEGPTAGQNYDQLRLSNPASSVVLAGTLEILAVPNAPIGASIFIIDHTTSTTPVTGTFADLPQNAEFYASGQWWRILYNGGSGNDVTVIRLPPSAWQAWVVANFSTDAASPAISGSFEDPDGDRVVNHFEYAFGGDPNRSAQNSLPRASELGGRLAITFTRVVAHTDVTLTVQGADNPGGPWTPLARSTNGAATQALVAEVTVNETGTGLTRVVEVRDLYLTNDQLHPKRFLRVVVTRE